MFLKIVVSLAVIVAGFLGYVATRDGKFNYERIGIINAPAEKIYPFISNFKMGEQWSPYEKIDPNMKKTFSGNDGEVGSIMEFEGNSDVGSGKLEILSLVPNEMVQIKLTMIKPFFGENIVHYRLKTLGPATQFTWSMTGDGGFMGKLMTLLIDCEKMVGDQFTKGIQNLKAVVEAQP